MFWKSAYTEVIHEFKEKRGSWAYVKCQDFVIPGELVEHPDEKQDFIENLDGERLCHLCFPVEVNNGKG
jgi:hypothetical protein